MMEASIVVRPPDTWVSSLGISGDKSVQFRTCLPYGNKGGRGLIEFDDDVDNEGLIEKIRIHPSVERVEVHRTDDGRISASVINHSCCASQALAASDCFLMSAYSMGEGKVRWKLVTGMEGSLLSLVKSLRDAGCETEVEWIRAIRESNLLTKRQEEVLRTAVKEGYYEIPKRIYLEGLAKKMKVRPSTLGEILKRAEKAIIEDYLENR
jgi:predicted DNA binding protein